ncbi:hypothetical protein [Micromonospora sp. B9E7]|uniref:hypothetical protein n=1 Tax=Micromonospora sp. B9E7 TaxID=3153574 RepID=UPI00325F0FE9
MLVLVACSAPATPDSSAGGEFAEPSTVGAPTAEPTAASALLDAAGWKPGAGSAIRDYQRTQRAGVLVISHDQTLLDRWADRIVDLDSRSPART